MKRRPGLYRAASTKYGIIRAGHFESVRVVLVRQA